MITHAEPRRAHPAAPAFSRPLVADDVPDDGLESTIDADPNECEAVAAEIGLVAVAALTARFRIERRGGGRLHVEGEVRARIAQICVVSLEPFDSEIESPIEIDFARPRASLAQRDGRGTRGGPARSRHEIDAPPSPTSDEDEPPDPIVDGRIDLGSIAVEFLALGLDFYPRKPGVEFSPTVVGDMDAPKPFAALERFKDRS